MKKMMLLLTLLSSTAFAAQTLELVHVQNFKGTPESVIAQCHQAMAADSRCESSKFVCSCSDEIAVAGLNIFMVEQKVEKVESTPIYSEDEQDQETMASCTFVEVKKLKKGKYEVGRKHKEYADSLSTLDESKRLACDKAKRACEEDAYLDTRCVRSDRVTPGHDYADEEHEGDILDTIVDGVEIITDIISIFKK